jgi:hypothetical protein
MRILVYSAIENPNLFRCSFLNRSDVGGSEEHVKNRAIASPEE